MADHELLGVVLGRGGAEVAGALLGHFGSVANLAQAEVRELMVVDGVGERRAIRVHAALALARRVRAMPTDVDPVTTPRAALRWLRPALEGGAVEELHALYLDRRRRPLAVRALSRGSDRFTVVDPRQVFRPALGLGASGVILAHNHPSGDPTPSAQDGAVTKRVADAGEALGVELVDHLVVAAEGATSMRERGLFGGTRPLADAWTA